MDKLDCIKRKINILTEASFLLPEIKQIKNRKLQAHYLTQLMPLLWSEQDICNFIEHYLRKKRHKNYKRIPKSSKYLRKECIKLGIEVKLDSGNMVMKYPLKLPMRDVLTGFAYATKLKDLHFIIRGQRKADYKKRASGRVANHKKRDEAIRAKYKKYKKSMSQENALGRLEHEYKKPSSTLKRIIYSKKM